MHVAVPIDQRAGWGKGSQFKPSVLYMITFFGSPNGNNETRKKSKKASD